MTKDLKMQVVGVVVTMVLLLLLFVPSVAFAAPTVYVDDDYSLGSSGGHTWNVDAFDNLQDGVNNTDPNGACVVAAGMYGNVTIGISGIDVHFESYGNPGIAIISGTGGPAVIISANDVYFEGFTVTSNSLAYPDAAIMLNSVTGCQVSNNIVENSFAGIGLQNSTNNGIIGNTANANGYGIGLTASGAPGSSGNVIMNNTVQNNTLAGVALDTYSDGNDVIDNTIINNSGDGGIYIAQFSDNNLIDNNLISGNTEGIYLWKATTTTIANNTISNNTSSGISMFGTQDNMIHGNKITGNLNGILLRADSVVPATGNDIYSNRISGNTNYGVELRVGAGRNPADLILRALNNYWGDNSGPGGVGLGTGDAVTDFVDYNPFTVRYIANPQTGDAVNYAWLYALLGLMVVAGVVIVLKKSVFNKS